jgi:hypothetical protein
MFNVIKASVKGSESPETGDRGLELVHCNIKITCCLASSFVNALNV